MLFGATRPAQVHDNVAALDVLDRLDEHQLAGLDIHRGSRGAVMIEQVIEKWHAHLRGQLPGGLDELLDDDVVFYSPIVYTPQRGKAITTMYLQAAGQTLPGEKAPSSHEAASEETTRRARAFRYTKTVLADDTAVLEFETTVEGKYVNGVDIIRCNDAGRIVEFRVMIRPLQAVNLVHQQMAATLEQMKPAP